VKRRTFGPDDVDLVRRETVFEGYFRIDRLVLRHRLFEGGRSGELVREVFERGEVGAVLPYDPNRDQVVLIEQFRPAPYANGDECWLLESVAGVLEAGERPAELARREAREEAGLAIGELLPMYTFYTSPGASTERVSLYCGRVDAGEAGGVHGLAEEGEDIRVHVIPRQEIPALLDGGMIANAKTIVALQWLLLHHAEVRRRWAAEVPDSELSP
jgi:ADP-ribose pyrophosphatase